MVTTTSTMPLLLDDDFTTWVDKEYTTRQQITNTTTPSEYSSGESSGSGEFSGSGSGEGSGSGDEEPPISVTERITTTTMPLLLDDDFTTWVDKEYTTRQQIANITSPYSTVSQHVSTTTAKTNLSRQPFNRDTAIDNNF